MNKAITTGTKITFTETGDKFELIQTEKGFDVKPIKLSKNIPTEPYTFQELLDEFESGKITIHGFEETDAPLVRSIFTNYIHTTEIEALKADIARITSEKEALQAANDRLTAEGLQLKTVNQDLESANKKLKTEKSESGASNEELEAANKKLKAENKELKDKNEKLNTALESMQDA